MSAEDKFDLKIDYTPQPRRKWKSKNYKKMKWFKALWVNTAHCVYCGREMNEEIKTADHIIARRNGGTNRRENIQIICKWCNKYKGQKSHTTMLRDTIKRG